LRRDEPKRLDPPEPTLCNPVRFQVLKETSMKMTVFWDVAPCSLVAFIVLMMEAVRTSETSVSAELLK
jgi:hypothetical protein